MILADDDFGTLVHAIELGRTVYDKVVSYVRFQMTQLLSLAFLFIAATVLNINDGMALTPLMVLFAYFFIVFAVILIAVDPADPTIMRRPPRDPKVPIHNRPAVTRWISYGAVRFLTALVPLLAGPDQPSVTEPSASMTMAFVVLCLSTAFSALALRRDPTAGLAEPVLRAAAILTIPVVLVVLCTELAFLRNGLMAQALTGQQWLVCIGLALITPIVIEIDKWIRRRPNSSAQSA